MKARVIIGIALLMWLTVIVNTAQGQATIRNSDSAASEDSLAISRLITAFYQTLSFDKTESNRYDSLGSYFIAQGLLVSNVGKEPQFFTVKQYREGARTNFTNQQITAWNETEVCATTEVFGKIAHRFSTYKIRLVSNGQESDRTGINTIQLIKQNSQWQIVSIAWDKETAALKIPAKYVCQ